MLPGGPLEAEPPAPLLPAAPTARPPAGQTRAVLGVVLGFVLVLCRAGLLRTAVPRRRRAASRRPATPSGPSTTAGSKRHRSQRLGDHRIGRRRQLKIVGATGFDPQGDGSEDNSLAPKAYDSKPTSGWTSDTYRTANWGGLKKGVGLRLDLGQPADRAPGHAADRRHRCRHRAARRQRLQPVRLDRARQTVQRVRVRSPSRWPTRRAAGTSSIWFTTTGPVQRRVPGRGRRRAAAMTPPSHQSTHVPTDRRPTPSCSPPTWPATRTRSASWSAAIATGSGPWPCAPSATARRRPTPSRRPCSRPSAAPTPSAATPRSPPGCTGSSSTPAWTGSGAGPPGPPRRSTSSTHPSGAMSPARPSSAWTWPAPWPSCPEAQRVALVLVDMQGLPVAEVAQITGVPEGTVKSRCARGRAALAPLLRPGADAHRRNPRNPTPGRGVTPTEPTAPLAAGGSVVGVNPRPREHEEVAQLTPSDGRIGGDGRDDLTVRTESGHLTPSSSTTWPPRPAPTWIPTRKRCRTADRAALQAHLDSCAACRSALGDQVEVSAWLRRAPGPGPMPADVVARLDAALAGAASTRSPNGAPGRAAGHGVDVAAAGNVLPMAGRAERAGVLGRLAESRVTKSLVAAAAVALIAAGGFAALHNNNSGGSTTGGASSAAAGAQGRGRPGRRAGPRCPSGSAARSTRRPTSPTRSPSSSPRRPRRPEAGRPTRRRPVAMPRPRP